MSYGEDTILIDLSKKQLTTFPRDILECNNLKMLCLNDNQLEKLPTNLFVKLPKLAWLDVRNNNLVALPTQGLSDHFCLETLLLQGNCIQKLPLELGRTMKLKTLQLSGNPLKYPNPNIMSAGTTAIKNFLKAELKTLQSNNESRPVEGVNTQEKLKISKTKSNRKRDEKKITIQELLRSVRQSPFAGSDLPLLTVKSCEHCKEDDENLLNKKVPVNTPIKKSDSKNNVKKTPVNNSDKYLEMQEMKSNQTRVEEQALKDMWTTKLKELLNRQAETIQRRRNLESLKSWRQQVLKYKRKSEFKFDTLSDILPYDTDPECNRILSRSDVEKINPNEVKRIRKPPKKVDINKKINEVIESINQLDSLQATELSVRDEQRLLENEINKLTQLQKTLSALQYENISN